MIDNNFNTVIDISSIIWNENDFNNNKSNYYNLILGVGILFEKLIKEKPKVILRNDLCNQMMNEFPFDKLPIELYEYGNIVYSFLSNVGSDFVEYSANIISNIESIPDQIKEHYKECTKKEIGYLISRIHSDDELENIFFTFEYLWNGYDNLITKTFDKTKTYKTIISDKGNDLDDFLAKLKPIFEHNDKHNCEAFKTKEAWKKCDTRKEFISQLSCYCNKDNSKPQNILNKAIKHKFEYIGFDEENEVWIRFKCHRDNLFHGFDEYDDENPEIIPTDIKSKFNK